MMRGMYAAISGLQAHQTMLDVTANNLANVDTVGFKSQSTDFADELSQQISSSTSPNSFSGGTNAEQVGLGVGVGAIETNMNEGSFQTTGNPLDIAISGSGFLEVANAAAPTAAGPTAAQLQGAVPAANTFQYTRAGNLTINSNGYLVTQNGQYLIGQGSQVTGGQTQANGTEQLINIPTSASNVAIGKNGQITYTDSSGTSQTAGFLEMSSFPNAAGLTSQGGNVYSVSPSSGSPTPGTPGATGLGTTIGGTLEMSNVDMATEFTNMITAERGYQANSKVISTADQMLQTVVNMSQG
jgi:flagellar hook protein FlgE